MIDELAALPNLGPKSAEMLRSAGIDSLAELRAAGAVVAYLRVKQSGHRPSKNLLWAIYGALRGKRWDRLTAAERAALLDELDSAEST